jgi:hypothetical protein
VEKQAAVPYSERKVFRADYDSAVKPSEGDPTRDVRAEQLANASKLDALGLTNPLRASADKAFIPTTAGKSKNSFFAYNLDKVAANLDRIAVWGSENPKYFESLKTGYDSPTSPKILADLNTYQKNQANGYAGDGRKLATVTVDKGGAGPIPVNPNYTPTILPKEQAQFLNLLMGTYGKGRSATKSFPDVFSTRLAEAMGVGVHLAEGETATGKPSLTVEANAMAKKLEELGFDPRDLETAFENLRYDRFLTTPEEIKGATLAPAYEQVVQAGLMPAEADANVQRVSKDYVSRVGIEYKPHDRTVAVDVPLSKRIADFYESAVDAPDAPEVKKAYQALANETVEQWKSFQQEGYTAEPWTKPGQPYANSKEMLADVTQNKHLYYFKTEEGYGSAGITDAMRASNPMLAASGVSFGPEKNVPVNDVFRVVHDIVGHGARGYEFGPKGEFNAYLEHSRMFSPDAKPALAAETLAQNSWVNYGPHLRKADGSIPSKGMEGFVPMTERPYAPQKNIVISKELLDAVEAHVEKSSAALMPALATETPDFKKWSKGAKIVKRDDVKDYDFQTGKPFVAETVHGTGAEVGIDPATGMQKDFEAFDLERGGEKTGAESARMAVFSTDNPDVAVTYASNIGMGGAFKLALKGPEDSVKSTPRFQSLQKDYDAAREATSAAYKARAADVREIFDRDYASKPEINGLLKMFMEQSSREESLNRIFNVLADGIKPSEEAAKRVEDASAAETRASEALAGYIYDSESSALPQRLIPLAVRMDNPKVFDAQGATPADFQLSERMAQAKAEGHDGVVFRNLKDPDLPATHFASFKPENLKSTISPTFDPANPAAYMPAGKAEVQFKSKAKEGSVGGVLDLVHFSSKDVREIDPNKSFGKGAAQTEDRKGLNKAFFYTKGTSYENGIARRPNIYEAKVDGNAIYDYNADPLGVRGILNRTKREQAIVDAGFAGYYSETPGFDAVAMFETTKLKPTDAESVMNRRQLIDTGRAESTPADEKAFAKQDAQIARDEANAEKLQAKTEAAVKKSPEYKAEYKRLVASDKYVEGSFFFDQQMDNWVGEQVDERIGGSGSPTLSENAVGKRPFSPEIRDLLQRRKNGEKISQAQFDEAVNATFPSTLVPVPTFESLPTRKEIDNAIDKGQRESRINVSTLEAGDKVTLRQDVPSWTKKGVGVVTVQTPLGKGYEASAAILNPVFKTNEKASLKIAMGDAKGPHIAVLGEWDANQAVPDNLGSWTQVGYNPDRHSFYYERGTNKEVVSGDRAFQVGNTVFVENPVYGKGSSSELRYMPAEANATGEGPLGDATVGLGGAVAGPLAGAEVLRKKPAPKEGTFKTAKIAPNANEGVLREVVPLDDVRYAEIEKSARKSESFRRRIRGLGVKPEKTEVENLKAYNKAYNLALQDSVKRQYKAEGGEMIPVDAPVVILGKSKTTLAKKILDTNPDAMFERLDRANSRVSDDPMRMVDPKGYAELMQTAGIGSDNGVTIPPPSPMLKLMLENGKGYVDLVQGKYHGDKTVAGTVEAAMSGLDSTVKMRDAIGGRPPPLVTAMHHLWGILSRMLPPTDQEAMWLRLVASPEVRASIQASLEGNFNLSEAQWEQTVQNARLLNPTKRGNNATSNANDFYLALTRLNGKWDAMSDAYGLQDSKASGRAFAKITQENGALGIRNKVQRFVGLTFGTPGLIMDRWKFVEFFHNLYGPTDGYFKYSETGTPSDPKGIYQTYGKMDNANHSFSLAFYEMMEGSLQKAIDNSPEIRTLLGNHPNVGGLHWVGWNAIKNEAVGHSSLDLTYDLVKRSKNPTVDDIAALLAEKEYYVEGAVGNRIERYTLPLQK